MGKLLDLAHEAILVRSFSDGKVVLWNQGAERMYGWPARDAIGKVATELLATESSLGLAGIEHRLAAVGHWEGNLRQRHRSGQFITVSARLARHTGVHDRPDAVLEIHSDLSRQVETEARLGVSEGMFQLFVSAVQDYAIFMLDPSGYIASWNDGAVRIKGYTADEAIGRHFSSFYTEEARKRGKPERVLATAAREGHVEDEDWRVRKDGSRFWANVVMTALRDQTGTLLGFGKVTRDLTRRRQAELDRLDHERQEAEALRAHAARLSELERAKTEFLNLASHELRTPLAVVRGYTSLLMDGSLSPAEYMGVAPIVEAKLSQIEWMVQKMLEAARLDQDRLNLEVTDIEIPALIRDQVEAVRPQLTRGHEIRVDVKVAPSSRVRGDAGRIGMIVLNLVDNAIKYSPKGGLIHLRATAAEGWVYVSVSDQGIGIEPDDLPKLFQRFTRLTHPQTTSVSGTGLGLYLCRQIAQQHGGDITVESRPAEGSRFTLCLPTVPAKPAGG